MQLNCSHTIIEPIAVMFYDISCRKTSSSLPFSVVCFHCWYDDYHLSYRLFGHVLVFCMMVEVRHKFNSIKIH